MGERYDEIRIKGLRFHAFHGVGPSEKENGQLFLVDITMRANLRPAGLSDDLSRTVNYAEACYKASEIFTGHKYDLIEAAAEAVAVGLLREYAALRSVSVEVFKPEAPINADFDNVSVYITRERHTAFIAVGSNIGDGPEIVDKAAEMINESKDTVIVKRSGLITTKPYGPVEQADFTNGMWEVETFLSPEELLELLHKTENALGRERSIHWGPRTMDLDIIYYDDLVMGSEDLAIPHPDMHNRTFVLEPLNEIAPYVRHPITGLTPSQMLSLISSGN